MNTEEILANKRAREDALAMLEPHKDEIRQRFWEIVLDRVKAKLSTRKTDQPMSEAEAIEFESEPVTFGVHRGKCVGQVPIAYWDWLRRSEFNVSLARYIASDRVHRMQANAED